MAELHVSRQSKEERFFRSGGPARLGNIVGSKGISCCNVTKSLPEKLFNDASLSNLDGYTKQAAIVLYPGGRVALFHPKRPDIRLLSLILS